MHQRLQLQLGEGERREHGLELYVAEPAAIGVGCTKGGEKGLEAVLHALGGAVAAGGGGGGAAQPVRTALVHKFGQIHRVAFTGGDNLKRSDWFASKFAAVSGGVDASARRRATSALIAL
eukprot:scaffold8873_cov55-Phaeocystis_antarctica.AAC.2